jgi:hypothetical protein
VSTTVAYGIVAAAIVFMTVSSARRREHGQLLRFYFLIAIVFGGGALLRAVPNGWEEEVAASLVGCILGWYALERRYQRSLGQAAAAPESRR